jgi:hypothetical protein
MATLQHDFIVSALARKIKLEKYSIIYLDGHYQEVCTIKPNIPPKIINHRPDIIGAREDQLFVIGEAKTKNDISSLRTKKQITDFCELISCNIGNKLILGIPLNSKNTLLRLLKRLNLISNKQIEILYVPDQLIPEENEI